LLNPTGGEIRSDSMGDGHYGARRDNGSRTHAGIDFVAIPYQPVIAPISGIITRKVIVYPDSSKWVGLEIKGNRATIKLFYVVPDDDKISIFVHAGDVIGTAQDISKRYSPKMTPHVHLEIVKLDPMCLMEV